MIYEFLISRRHLKAPRRNAFVSFITLMSVAGVVIGVMALIIVIAVMSGFEKDIKERILGVESHVVLFNRGGEIFGYNEIVDHIEQMDPVVSTQPFVVTQVMLRSSSGVTGGVLRGLDPARAATSMSIFEAIGPLEDKLTCRDRNSGGVSSPPGIILGKELAARLGVREGDIVYLVLSMGALSPAGHMPAVKRFEVTAIFEAGMHDFDSAFAFVHLSEAQRILHMEDSVSGIDIRVKDIYQARDIAKKIVSRLGYPFYARDWMTMNRNLFAALKLEKVVMFIILTLIVLVAAFNIASSLIMIVMNKRKEIGILKAMGATRKSVRRIFVLEGMLIGGVGTILGGCLGVVACALLKQYQFIELDPDVYYITTLPVQLEWLDVTLIAGAALAICYLATLYPAIQASRVNPVEAIRYG